MELPRQPDRLFGWQIDHEFLMEVKAEIKSKTGEKITLEAVEDVLIALEKVTKRRSLI